MMDILVWLYHLLLIQDVQSRWAGDDPIPFGQVPAANARDVRRAYKIARYRSQSARDLDDQHTLAVDVTANFPRPSLGGTPTGSHMTAGGR